MLWLLVSSPTYGMRLRHMAHKSFGKNINVESHALKLLLRELNLCTELGFVACGALWQICIPLCSSKCTCSYLPIAYLTPDF